MKYNFILLFLVAFLSSGSFALRTRDSNPNIGVFWHFSDIHLDTTYVVENPNDLWGNYLRDTSLIVAETGIENAIELAPSTEQPDFVIWSGDSAPHNKTLIQDDVLAGISKLSTWFTTTFSIRNNTPVLPIIGEYDLFPVSTISPHPADHRRENWCTRLAEEPKYWSTWIRNAAQSVNHVLGLPKPKFNETCYLSLLLPKSDLLQAPQILLLGLNSIVWYTQNPRLDTTIDDPLDQFSWLTGSLQWARENLAKVIVVTHLTPGTAELHPQNGQYIHPRYNQRLVSILRTFADVIITTLAGHEHVDGFRVLLSEKSKPIGTVFLGPSIDPIILPDRGDFNPRIRLYHYDRGTGVLLDYEQFWLNLSTPGPSWHHEYTARADYQDLPDLSPQSMATLLDQFTIYDNPDGKWSKYWTHQLGYRPHENRPGFHPHGYCHFAFSVCRCEHVCAMRHLDVDQWNHCVNNYCLTSINPKLPTIWDLSHPRHNMNQMMIILVTVGVLILVTLMATTIACISRKRHRIRKSPGVAPIRIR
ncbi:Sphingomyelin phosphodiesterase [Fasciola gigantica]|uniref:Sphingomyelin phosphodiesterase n=1 Tax=Fasciola gigantica TaxID=46835 RepID=A0A504YWW2_FASGI|nr:Sphingomyelin phosphodiesterase [Fasciola gigantica]